MQGQRPLSAQSSKKQLKLQQSLPEQTEDLEEYMDILLEHQKNCERSGKYVEAELAKKRIVEIKKEYDQRSKVEVKQRHFQEVFYLFQQIYNQRDEIEKAHLNEFNQFNEFWDKKMEEFEIEASKVEQETIEKQEQEVFQFQEELERSIPIKPKENTQILNLRKIEESLAKSEQYIEAHKVQQQIQKIEKDEQEKWLLQRNVKVKNLLSQLKTKQNNEINALRQRIDSGKEEQRKIRSIELEKLLQKYQNVRKELESSQTAEISKIDKMIKNGSLMSSSKMINSSRMTNGSMMKGSRQY